MPEEILIFAAFLISSVAALVWIFFNAATIKRLDRIAALLEKLIGEK